MPPSLSDPEYLLRGVNGTVFGRSYPLLAPATVGRAPKCDLHLADEGVSRQHARLRPLDCGVEVEDLGSTNGSFINGQRVRVGIAGVGDEIAFDQLRFRLLDRRAPHREVAASSHPPPRGRDRYRAWAAAAVLLALAAGAWWALR